MPIYTVVAISRQSGRARRKTYREYDAEEVRAVALERDGLIAKWIELTPYRTATRAQLQRLSRLGCRPDSELDVRQAGDLLRTLLSGDQPAGRHLLVFAEQLKIETTAYIGTRRLFDLIRCTLNRPGNEQPLAAWFTYRVYRQLAAGDHRALIDGPGHAVIQRIADFLVRDTRAMESLKQYRVGREWLRFGRFLDRQGRMQCGGRMDTRAYLLVRACLEKAFTQIPLLRPPLNTDKPAGTGPMNSLLPRADKAIHHYRLPPLKAS